MRNCHTKSMFNSVVSVHVTTIQLLNAFGHHQWQLIRVQRSHHLWEMQIKWLARAHTDPLAISNMRLPVHCGHHDTIIRQRHPSQHLHQWQHTANNIINISTNHRHVCHRRRHHIIITNNTIINTAQTIEMEIVASLQLQPHQCQPDRQCTINNNSTSKSASTLTKQFKKKMLNTAAAVNVYDIDRIIDVHYFDAFSIICGTHGPVSNFHRQLVNFHNFNFIAKFCCFFSKQKRAIFQWVGYSLFRLLCDRKELFWIFHLLIFESVVKWKVHVTLSHGWNHTYILHLKKKKGSFMRVRFFSFVCR